MERTWRWFGKKDKITLAMLRQIGVEGIVTALHDVPLGEVWTREKIRDLRQYIESYGMRWSVVESLPVVETIKYGGPDRDHQIEVYKESLRNLSAEGIHCICYNFMPVLDWARTDLLHINPNGSTNLYGRLTASARHLFDPAHKIYTMTMEEGVYEIDVDMLKVTELFRDGGNALRREGKPVHHHLAVAILRPLDIQAVCPQDLLLLTLKPVGDGKQGRVFTLSRRCQKGQRGFRLFQYFVGRLHGVCSLPINFVPTGFPSNAS